MDRQNDLNQLLASAGTTRDRLFIAAVFLFAQKGSARVGIREICRVVGIKESSFYNHFPGKESLLEEIFRYYEAAGERMVLSDEELASVTASPDLHQFFARLMEKFGAATHNPLFFNVLQVLTVEGFTNRTAFEIARNNLYHFRRDYTERALTAMRSKGFIRADIDIPLITAEYYYGLMGLLDEYVLLALWNEDVSETYGRIERHVAFFVHLLKP